MNWSKIIKNYTLALLSIIGIIAMVWISGFKTNFPAPEQRTNSEFMSTIANTHKELFTKDSQPIFKISKIDKPTANWYVLHLTLAKDNGPSGILIVNDPHFDSSYMKVIAGPESKFSRDNLVKQNIPGAVINLLRNEGDL